MPTEITKNTQHNEEGLALFIDRYKNKPRMAALLTIFMNQIQDLEDALFELITDRTIDAAIGVQLDILGDIVGQPDRAGLSDDNYRTIIRARIKVNRSDGHGDQMIEILLLIALGLQFVETPVQILFTDHHPAGFVLQILTKLGAVDPSAMVPDVSVEIYYEATKKLIPDFDSYLPKKFKDELFVGGEFIQWCKKKKESPRLIEWLDKTLIDEYSKFLIRNRDSENQIMTKVKFINKSVKMVDGLEVL